MEISRRALMQAAAVPLVQPERVEMPKICLGASTPDEAGMRRIKQIGVDHVLMGGPPIPWQVEDLRARLDRWKSGGLSVCNLMIYGFNDAIFAKPGRDDEIEKAKQSIHAAGKAGVPVVEYNWYAHRAMEGYYEEIGRAGAGLTAFDYDRMKDLPPAAETRTLDELWASITYFLKAVAPAAEEARVKLAIHPNDPPAPLSRGCQQIMATVAGWKRLIEVVPSPASGITYDCGVTREMGEDPVEVCRYFASRKRIHHAHFRNVKVRKPYEKYTEVFIDEGEVDMFGVMKELVRNRYAGAIYPEHPRALDYDRERGPIRGYPGGGGYAGEVYSVGYTRAMLQAALHT